MSLSPRPDKTIFIFEGQKVIWSIHTTIDVVIVEHSEHFTIEVLGYNPETKQESPRLYLDTFKIDEMINSYEPLEPVPSTSNQRLSPIRMTHEKRNENRKKFLLSRLGVNAKIHRHKGFELVLEPKDGEKLHGLRCLEIPSKLIPVAADYFQLHASEPSKTALSWQKSQGNEHFTVETSKYGARHHDGNHQGLFHHNNEIYKNASIGISSDDADIGVPMRGLRTRHDRGSFDGVSSLWQRMRSSIFSTGESSRGIDSMSDRYLSTGGSPGDNAEMSCETKDLPSDHDMCLKSVDEEEDFALMQKRMQYVQKKPMSPHSSHHHEVESKFRLKGSGESPRSNKILLSYGLSVLSTGPVPESKLTDSTEAAAVNTMEKRDSWRVRRMTVATVPDSNSSDVQKAAAFTGGHLHRQDQHKDRRSRERRRSFHRRRAGVLGQLGIGKNSHQVDTET